MLIQGGRLAERSHTQPALTTHTVQPAPPAQPFHALVLLAWPQARCHTLPPDSYQGEAVNAGLDGSEPFEYGSSPEGAEPGLGEPRSGVDLSGCPGELR